MHLNIADCCRLRTDSEWCGLNSECKGWGCRLLTVVPTNIPKDDDERGALFSKVFRTAERIGVLQCPFFHEEELDSLVENEEHLLNIMEQIC